MKGRRPDFVVRSAVGALGPHRRRELGVAFWNRSKDALIVLLDALPLSGKLVLSTQGITDSDRDDHGDVSSR